MLSGVDERGILFSDGGTPVTNLILGDNAGRSAMTGQWNVLLGQRAGSSLTTGHQNVALGVNALRDANSGAYNFALGTNSLRNVTSGQQNIAIGTEALDETTTGGWNIGIGFKAMELSTTGNYNVVLGYSAMSKGGTINRSIAIGYAAGDNVAGDGGVFIGYSAGQNEVNGNKLYIANTNTATPLIYGEFDGAGNVGVKIHSPVATAVGLTVKGIAAQTANLFELQESDGSIFVASGDGLGGSEFIINEQGEDIDFRVEGDTEDHLLTVDAGTDTVRMGDWDTNYSQFASNGDQSFVGSAGFYPRTVAQAAQPAAGVGATQIDSGEMIFWIDTDDGDKCYLMFNYATALHKKEMDAI